MYTGNVSGSGTDATVFLCLIGESGDSGDRFLVNCKNNVNKFEKGKVSLSFREFQHANSDECLDLVTRSCLFDFFRLCNRIYLQGDEFIIEAVSIGPVCRVRIGHDGRGGGCGWFLDKVVVKEDGQADSEAIEFPCNRYIID